MIVQEKVRALENRAETSREKRKEARYPTNDAAEVRVLPSNGETVPATIIDISKSGLRLELGRTLLKGRRLEITISPRKLVIFGEVRYCRRVGGVYQAGVLIEGVVSPDQSAEAHLVDDEIRLFVIGKGLAAPDVLRAKDHISTCDTCSGRMRATMDQLHPRRNSMPRPRNE